MMGISSLKQAKTEALFEVTIDINCVLQASRIDVLG